MSQMRKIETGIQSEFITNYLSNSNERMKINSVFTYVDINKTLSCHNVHRHSFTIHYFHSELLCKNIWDETEDVSGTFVIKISVCKAFNNAMINTI